jgi:hypothetical protein
METCVGVWLVRRGPCGGNVSDGHGRRGRDVSSCETVQAGIFFDFSLGFAPCFPGNLFGLSQGLAGSAASHGEKASTCAFFFLTF